LFSERHHRACYRARNPAESRTLRSMSWNAAGATGTPAPGGGQFTPQERCMRRRTPRFGFIEPLAIQRRRTVRMLFTLRWTLARCMIYGAVLAAVGHAAMAHAGIPLPIHPLHYYSKLIVALPAMIFVMCGYLMLIPSRVLSISPSGFAITSGGSAMGIAAERLVSWGIRGVRGRANIVLLRLRFRGRRDRVLRATIGVPPKIDLIALDRALRRTRRVGSMRLRKRRLQREARYSRKSRRSAGLMPAACSCAE
jgi:hypothetical protein